MIRVKCPACGEVVDVDERYRGKRGRCKCGNVFQLEEDFAFSITTFTPSAKLTPKPFNAAIAFAIVPAVLVLVVLFVGYAFWTRSSTATKSALLATSEKFDGREAGRLRFWVDYREAGHGSWADLDSRVESQSFFGPKLVLSEETKQAYKKWRSAATSQPRLKDTRKSAKIRLDRTIHDLESANGYAEEWVAEVEAGKRSPSGLEYSLRGVGCSEETIAAYQAWVKVAMAEAK